MNKRLTATIAQTVLSVSALATPTVFVTDIGGDVDDTWALALLRSPELELKMVLTETGEARYRHKSPPSFSALPNGRKWPLHLGWTSV